MKIYLFSVGALFLILLISGCTQIKQVKRDIETFETPFISEGENPLESPASLCINLCREQRDKGVDLSSGPCLSDRIMEGWVCDVAHDPRVDIDNNPANQCGAYLNGTARHFVEVDLNCNLIRTR